MKKVWTIETEQVFSVTYDVEADSAEEAWGELMAGNGDCVDQMPDRIHGTFENSHIEEGV